MSGSEQRELSVEGQSGRATTGQWERGEYHFGNVIG